MRLLTSVVASLRAESTYADMVSPKLLGPPTIVTVSALPLTAGGVEVTDYASGERSVSPMEDVEAELPGAA